MRSKTIAALAAALALVAAAPVAASPLDRQSLPTPALGHVGASTKSGSLLIA